MNNYKPEDLDKIINELKKIIIEPINKKWVIDLRLFIDEIYPRETDTSKQDILDISHRFVGFNKRLEHIEECLGIDFKLDSEKNVDYHFIKDILIRDKVTAYYREMLRYQYGTRNHKICFGEFCRLATIQLELILNYFFKSANNIDFLNEEIDKLANKRHQKVHNNWVKRQQGPEPILEDCIKELKNNKEDTLSQIFLSTKSNIFINKYLEKDIIDGTPIRSLSIWISSMRNRKSHGSWSSLNPYEENYMTEEEKLNLEKWEKELLDKVEVFNKDNVEKIQFLNKRLIANKKTWKYLMPSDLKDLYNESFAPLQWVSEKPFEEVHEFLRKIANTCAKELKKK